MSRLAILNPSELRLQLRIALFLTRIPSLAQLPLPRLYQRLEPESAPSEPVRPLDEAMRIRRAIGRAFRVEGRWIPMNCLTTGFASYHFMRRSGLNVSLCFGVNKSRVESDAHCWLERNGEPFMEPVDPALEFIEIYRFQPHLPKLGE